MLLFKGKWANLDRTNFSKNWYIESRGLKLKVTRWPHEMQRKVSWAALKKN